jgi:predicted nucleic acid-binding protein
VAVRQNTIKKALALNERYEYSYYDCLIIASSLEAGCKYLFSEDMQHGQIIENSLKIINPFVA